MNENISRHEMFDLSILKRQMLTEIREVRELVEKQNTKNKELFEEAKKKRTEMIEMILSEDWMTQYTTFVRNIMLSELNETFNNLSWWGKARKRKKYERYRNRLQEYVPVKYNEAIMMFEYPIIPFSDDFLFLSRIKIDDFNVFIEKEKGIVWVPHIIHLQVYDTNQIQGIGQPLGPVEYLEYWQKRLEATRGSDAMYVDMIDSDKVLGGHAHYIWTIRHDLVARRFDLNESVL